MIKSGKGGGNTRTGLVFEGKTEPSIKAKKAFRDLCERKGLTFDENNG